MNIKMASPVKNCPECKMKSLTMTYSKDYPNGRYECSNCDYAEK